MASPKLSISSMSYEKKDDIRILTSCLSNWFSNPKILHFVSPSMSYPFKIKQWVSQSYSNQSNTLVLKLDNWIIGHISIKINNQKESAHIFHLIIDPVYQQKGYGKQLIYNAEKLINEYNIKKITVSVSNNNQIGKKFFEKNGFTAVKIGKSKRIMLFKNLD